MNSYLKISQNLLNFIYDSPSPFHVVNNMKYMLDSNHYEELKDSEKWNLVKGGKYYTIKNQSAIIAFCIGNKEIEDSGIRIVGAHTDSPTFKIKPNPQMISKGDYIKLNTEVYGGPILNTWMDRPLSLAGRVTVRGKNPFNPEMKLVNVKRPILIIPNLAIHMNRNVNKGYELNKQKDMLPILGLINEKLEEEDYLLRILCKELNVKKSDILDFELLLYEFEKGCIMGIDDEFISSPRLDDLSMVHAGLNALIENDIEYSTQMLVCFDNEEVGSSTKQGADSPLLSSIIERIVIGLGKDREDYFRTLSKSFMISCDSAHAVHPNREEKTDPTNKPIINKGPVIKINSNQSYTSDVYSISVYEEICNLAEVPVQKFVNRSDERGGSTIGPISSTHVNIDSVDVGTALLAMHSVRELGGVKDQVYMIESLKKFYTLK
ncbi:M18 family aminopeptidase [Clostridium botulinum]|nr:M18 family aminopeptidase [Clostridium botulinum]